MLFHSKACEIETDPKAAAEARKRWGNPPDRELAAKAALRVLNEQKAEEERNKFEKKIAHEKQHSEANFAANLDRKIVAPATSNKDLYDIAEKNAKRDLQESCRKVDEELLENSNKLQKDAIISSESAHENLVEVTQNEIDDTKSLHKTKQLTIHGNPKRNRGDAVAFKHKPDVLVSPSGLEIQKVELEKKWLFYVQQGRAMVDGMGRKRLELAQLAIEACDIHHGGGGHWNNFEKVFTLSRFAEEIRVSYKTLHNWTRIKRNVYDKLIAAGQEVDVVAEWAVMSSAANHLDKDATPDQVVRQFNKWSTKAAEGEVMNPERYFLQGLRRLRSLNHYFVAHNPSKKTFDKQDLDEMKSLCKNIVKWLEK